MITSEEEFLYWLKQAKRGDKKVYYVGYLAPDRYFAINISLEHLVEALLHAFKLKQVFLFQRRLGKGRFEYQVARR